MKYYNITVNGVAYSVSVEGDRRLLPLQLRCSHHQAPAAPLRSQAAAPPVLPVLSPSRLPMPSNILDVKGRSQCFHQGQ